MQPAKHTLAIGAAGLLAVAASIAPAQQGTGVTAINLPAGSDTYVSVPFTENAVGEFAIATGGINGNTLTLAGASFGPDQFGANSNGEPLYYVRFTSGALAGKWYNIASHQTNTVSLNREDSSDPADLSAASEGDTLVIYPHQTLSRALPAGLEGVSFVASPGPQQIRTQVLLPDNTNVGTNKAPSQTFVFNQSAGGWLNRNGFSPANDVVLPPQSYFIIRNTGQQAPASSDDPSTLGDESTNDLTFYTFGGVQSAPLTEQIAINASANDVNLSVENVNGIELSDLELGGTSAFETSSGPQAIEDQLLVFDRTQQQTNKAPAKTFVYNAAAGGWLDRDGFTVANDFDLPPAAVLIIRKAGDSANAGTQVEWTQSP